MYVCMLIGFVCYFKTTMCMCLYEYMKFHKHTRVLRTLIATTRTTGLVYNKHYENVHEKYCYTQ